MKVTIEVSNDAEIGVLMAALRVGGEWAATKQNKYYTQAELLRIGKAVDELGRQRQPVWEVAK